MTAAAGAVVDDVQVDHSQIEKSLANLWRGAKEGERAALTRAALWNVVAHTSSPEHQALASETLAKASASVPQRSIIVRANPSGEPELTSFVGANIHPGGGGRTFYSEEVSIVASGDRIYRVAPLVSSLLIPDMPVAVWWLGDLPTEREEYVEALLGPADRLIVDSVHFNSPADLALVSRIAQQTFTAPADLNWVRLEEWRMATASVFDPLSVRARLGSVRKIRVVSGASDDVNFGQQIEALLLASWLSAQLDHQIDAHGRVEGAQGAIEYAFESRRQTTDVGGVTFVELRFNDGSSATISRDRAHGVLMSNVDGTETVLGSITRARACDVHDLIARLLKRQDGDHVFLKTLPIAARMANRITK